MKRVKFYFGHYLRDPLNQAFRWAWCKTLPEQGVLDGTGQRFRYGRWEIQFHRFQETLDSGFMGRSEMIRLDQEIVAGWLLLYRPGDESPMPDVEVAEGQFIRLPHFPEKYQGIWIATNPWRKRIAVCGVGKSQKPVAALRELAMYLSMPGKKKFRVAWVGNILNWLEDRPAATELMIYAAAHTLLDGYDPTRDPTRWRKPRAGAPLGVPVKPRLVDGKWVRE